MWAAFSCIDNAVALMSDSCCDSEVWAISNHDKQFCAVLCLYFEHHGDCGGGWQCGIQMLADRQRMSEDRRQVNMAQEILGTPQPADTFKQGWNFEVYIWPCRHSLLKPQHCGIVTSNTEFPPVGFSAKSILPFLAICSTDSVLNQSNSISSRWEINKAVVSVPKTINS